MTALRRGARLGGDVRKARVGVAISDPDGMLATTLVTVARDPNVADDVLASDSCELARLVRLHGVVEVVVARPVTLAGDEGQAAAHVRAYAAELAAVVAPV